MTYFSEQDVALINAHRKSENKMGFAVLLFCLRSIGFIPDINSPHPVSLLKSIASRLNLSDEFWQDYALGRDTTWREHLTELYRYINLRTFTKQIQQDCIGHLIPLATRTDKGILLAEELLDYLSAKLHYYFRYGSVGSHLCRSDGQWRQTSIYSTEYPAYSEA